MSAFVQAPAARAPARTRRQPWWNDAAAAACLLVRVSGLLAGLRLLDLAARVQTSHPTYYGAAWLALGRVLPTTNALGGCATGSHR